MVLIAEKKSTLTEGTEFGLEYSATRIRAWQTRLLDSQTMHELVKMDLPKLTRFLGEKEYGEELEALGISFSGRQLVEAVLERNIMRTFRAIKSFSTGMAEKLITSLLWKWDLVGIQAALTVRFKKASPALVDSVFWPLGNLTRDDLQAIWDAPDGQALAAIFAGTPFHQTLLDWLEEGEEDLKGLLRSLGREYYSKEFARLQNIFPRDKAFHEILEAEIAAYNFHQLTEGSEENWGERDLLESVVSIEERWHKLLEKMLESTALEAIQTFLEESPHLNMYRELSPDCFTQPAIGRMEIHLRRWVLALLSKRLILFPSPPLTIFAYLFFKRLEVINIRAIALGKEAGWREDRITESLILAGGDE